MLKQFKYSVRQSLDQRLAVLAVVVLLNAAFGILGGLGLYGEGWKITAVVFSSLALCAAFIACILADAEQAKGLFEAPRGYTVLLAPVPSWKILLARILPAAVMDLLLYAIAIAGVVLQSLILAGVSATDDGNSDMGQVLFFLALFVLGYTMIMTFIYFVGALSKSVFYKVKLRGILAFLTGIAAMYILSFADLALAPFGHISRFGWLIQVNLVFGFNTGSVLYLAVVLLKIVVLFTGTAYLVERKINV